MGKVVAFLKIEIMKEPKNIEYPLFEYLTEALASMKTLAKTQSKDYKFDSEVIKEKRRWLKSLLESWIMENE